MAKTRTKGRGRPGNNPRDRVQRAFKAGATGKPRPGSKAAPTSTATPPAPLGDMSDVLTADEAEAAHTWKVPVISMPGKFVVVQRTDMMSLVLRGTVPMALLANLDKLEDLQAAIAKDPTQVARINETAGGDMDEMLNAIAIEVVVAPRLTQADKPAPGELHVSRLTYADKLIIFKQATNPPRHVGSAPVGAGVTPEVAATFPRQPASTGVVDSVARDGESLRPGAVIVDRGQRGRVAVIGQ